MRKLESAPLVTAVVACFYVTFTLIALGLHDWNPLWFMWLGERFADLNPAGRMGYDGQFVYYIARDGLAGIPHLDNPPYRLQRILLPILVRLVSFGQPALMPWVAIFINVAVIVSTTYLLARWLDSQGMSAWYATAHALYVGVFMAYSRNLLEPVAFGLAGLGTVGWLRKKHAVAVTALALAALAKETALLFVFGLALAELAQKRLPRSLVVLASSLPLLAWEGYLLARFDVLPFTSGTPLQIVPLSGILPYVTAEPGRISALLFVALPALALPVVAVYGLVKNVGSHALWILLFNCVFVLLMPINVYDHVMHAGRNATGLVLATLFCLPLLARSLRRLLWACWVLPTFIWLIPVLRWAPWLSRI
jgi:hypothetical protein